MRKTLDFIAIALALAAVTHATANAATCNPEPAPLSNPVVWVNEISVSEMQIRLLHAFYSRAPKANLPEMAAQIEISAQAAIRIGIPQRVDIEERTAAAKTQIETVLGAKTHDFHCETIQNLAYTHALSNLYAEEVILSKIKPSDAEIDSFIETYKEQFKGKPISEVRQRVFNYLAQQRLGPPMEAETKRLRANATVRINRDFSLE